MQMRRFMTVYKLAKYWEHQNHTILSFPHQFCEEGLVRGNDALPLQTDMRSLADVDGDGVEIGEVVKAVFMMVFCDLFFETKKRNFFLKTSSLRGWHPCLRFLFSIRKKKSITCYQTHENIGNII